MVELCKTLNTNQLNFGALAAGSLYCIYLSKKDISKSKVKQYFHCPVQLVGQFDFNKNIFHVLTDGPEVNILVPFKKINDHLGKPFSDAEDAIYNDEDFNVNMLYYRAAIKTNLEEKTFKMPNVQGELKKEYFYKFKKDFEPPFHNWTTNFITTYMMESIMLNQKDAWNEVSKDYGKELRTFSQIQVSIYHYNKGAETEVFLVESDRLNFEIANKACLPKFVLTDKKIETVEGPPEKKHIIETVEVI